MRNQRLFSGISVVPDDPKFLEREVDVQEEMLDLASIDPANFIAEQRVRRANYDTTPFDPSGEDFRIYPEGFTIWSGFPGMGKTTILRQLLCQLMYRERKVFIASLEERPQDVLGRLCSVAHGTEEYTPEQLLECVDFWRDRLKIWSHRKGVADHAKLLAMIRVLGKDHGYRHAVIDSLARLDIDSGDWENQRLFGNLLETSAASSGMHIHLVAHPRKPAQSGAELDVSDVAGSADIGRLCDNIIFVRRAKEEQVVGEFSKMAISVKKQRYHTGACTTIEGYFDRRLKQYKPAMHDIAPTQYLPR